jgi:hypothetical protein
MLEVHLFLKFKHSFYIAKTDLGKKLVFPNLVH